MCVKALILIDKFHIYCQECYTGQGFPLYLSNFTNIKMIMVCVLGGFWWTRWHWRL
jgi:hypothetical protein